jgi:hypothetical protein
MAQRKKPVEKPRKKRDAEKGKSDKGASFDEIVGALLKVSPKPNKAKWLRTESLA